MGVGLKILSISLLIKAIIGELITVVTKVPRPMLWNDVYPMVESLNVFASSNKNNASRIDTTSKEISNSHFTLLMLNLKRDASSATNSSYT